jgi:hypothetical protein
VTEPELRVSGGAGGVGARYEDIAALGRHSDDIALSLASISTECHAVLVDPDVLASAVLNPKGVATFEKTLLGALDGRDGLTVLSVGFGQRAIALRTVAASYQAVDAAQARTIDSIRWASGYLLPYAAPVLAGAVVANPLLDASLGFGLYDQLSAPERLLTDHPGIVDNLVGAGPGLISTLPFAPLVSDVPGAARLIGMLYPDGTPQISGPGTDDSKFMTKPPQGFDDLLKGLNWRNAQAHLGHDEIDVRMVTHADGSKAYIVDIPGTKDWNLPFQSGDSPNDLGTNVHVMGGDVTSRERAIAKALDDAGASPTDPVMLIGHSQGGIVAAQAAHDSANDNFNFNVTHVLTAASPIARIDVPDHVQVLSLENSHDIVPHLDAADNPDRPNHTTVTFDTQYGNMGQNHGMGDSYVPAGAALDRSTDPSVSAYRDSARAFLTNGNDTAVRAWTYELTRQR